MLGFAFVMMALGHHRRLEGQLPVALVGLVAATLLVVNVANPDARVAEHNLTRSDAAEQLDADYVLGLSADAWPTILVHRELTVRSLREASGFDRRCQAAAQAHGYGVLGFNLATARVDCSG